MVPIGASRTMACIYTAVLLSAAVTTVSGASLTRMEEKSSYMMRRDAPRAATQQKLPVQLSANGEMISMAQTSSQEQKVEEQPRAVSGTHDGFCDKVFVSGVDGADDCGNFTLIQDEDACQKAADEMLLTRPVGAAGRVPQSSDMEKQRPRGCFSEPCAANPKGCIYLNDRDIDVNQTLWTITGTPVCLKTKYASGTVNDSAPVGCPDGYLEIKNEDECKVAASCQAKCTGDPLILKGVPQYNDGIQVPNSAIADYNKYPTGCFVSATEQCPAAAVGSTASTASAGTTVYFNPVKEGISLPTNPTGTPMCIATKEAYQGSNSSAKETDNDSPAVWFCVANIGSGAGPFVVQGPFTTIDAAKTALNANPGTSTNRQMICEMSENGPKSDPHRVGGQDQNAGSAGGFDKWWSGWPDMNLMNQKCGSDTTCLSGSPML